MSYKVETLPSPEAWISANTPNFIKLVDYMYGGNDLVGQLRSQDADKLAEELSSYNDRLKRRNSIEGPYFSGLDRCMEAIGESDLAEIFRQIGSREDISPHTVLAIFVGDTGIKDKIDFDEDPEKYKFAFSSRLESTLDQLLNEEKIGQEDATFLNEFRDRYFRFEGEKNNSVINFLELKEEELTRIIAILRKTPLFYRFAAEWNSYLEIHRQHNEGKKSEKDAIRLREETRKNTIAVVKNIWLALIARRYFDVQIVNEMVESNEDLQRANSFGRVLSKSGFNSDQIKFILDMQIIDVRKVVKGLDIFDEPNSQEDLINLIIELGKDLFERVMNVFEVEEIAALIATHDNSMGVSLSQFIEQSIAEKEQFGSGQFDINWFELKIRSGELPYRDSDSYVTAEMEPSKMANNVRYFAEKK